MKERMVNAPDDTVVVPKPTLIGSALKESTRDPVDAFRSPSMFTSHGNAELCNTARNNVFGPIIDGSIEIVWNDICDDASNDHNASSHKKALWKG